MWLGRRVLQRENQEGVRSEEIISVEGFCGRTEVSQGTIFGIWSTEGSKFEYRNTGHLLRFAGASLRRVSDFYNRDYETPSQTWDHR